MQRREVSSYCAGNAQLFASCLVYWNFHPARRRRWASLSCGLHGLGVGLGVQNGSGPSECVREQMFVLVRYGIGQEVSLAPRSCGGAVLMFICVGVQPTYTVVPCLMDAQLEGSKIAAACLGVRVLAAISISLVSAANGLLLGCGLFPSYNLSYTIYVISSMVQSSDYCDHCMITLFVQLECSALIRAAAQVRRAGAAVALYLTPVRCAARKEHMKALEEL